MNEKSVQNVTQETQKRNINPTTDEHKKTKNIGVPQNFLQKSLTLYGWSVYVNLLVGNLIF